MGKKVKLETIKLYQVYYIFTYLNILLYIAIVIQYYASLNSPNIQSQTCLDVDYHDAYNRLKPVTADHTCYQ